MEDAGHIQGRGEARLRGGFLNGASFFQALTDVFDPPKIQQGQEGGAECPRQGTADPPLCGDAEHALWRAAQSLPDALPYGVVATQRGNTVFMQNLSGESRKIVLSGVYTDLLSGANCAGAVEMPVNGVMVLEKKR